MAKAPKIPTAEQIEAAAKEEENAKPDVETSGPETPRATFDAQALVVDLATMKTVAEAKAFLDAHASDLSAMPEGPEKDDVRGKIEAFGKALEAAEAAARKPPPVRRPFIVERPSNVRLNGQVLQVPEGTKVSWDENEVQQALDQGVRLRPIDDPNEPLQVIARAYWELERSRAFALKMPMPPEWMMASDHARMPFLAKAQAELDAQQAEEAKAAAQAVEAAANALQAPDPNAKK